MPGRRRFGRPGGRTLLGVGVLGVAVLALGIWGATTHAVGEHVTECGFDANGAYARIRVDNVFGGAHEEDVPMTFHVSGDIMQLDYDHQLRSVAVPAHGSVTVVVHGRFPPLTMFSGRGVVDSEIRGRPIYRWEGKDVGFDPARDWRFVDRAFAVRHPATTSVEAVPDDPSMLHCSTSVGD